MKTTEQTALHPLQPWRWEYWSPGDEKPDAMPPGCQYWDHRVRKWGDPADIGPALWTYEPFRWPVPKLMPFDLLTTEEQDNVIEAKVLGILQVWNDGGWQDEPEKTYTPGDCTYRVDPDAPHELHDETAPDNDLEERIAALEERVAQFLQGSRCKRSKTDVMA